MIKGVSVYLGLEKSLEENISLLVRASQCGYSKVFLSLHLPEANSQQVTAELGKLVEAAHKLKLKVMGDVAQAGEIADSLDEVRLDEYFSPEEIALFHRQHPEQRIILNASTLEEKFLLALKAQGLTGRELGAVHNFYPRPHTGLSEAHFLKQNELLRAHGFGVGAFLPSQVGKRAPLYQGLPTLEECRHLTIAEGSMYLTSLGVEELYIGDDGPSEEELLALGQSLPEVVELPLTVLAQGAWIERFLAATYTVRPDEAQQVVRALESRTLAQNISVPAEKALPRNYGAVTVDNDLAGRYKGELELVREDLPSAGEVNVLGYLLPEVCIYLKMLKPGRKFCFKPVSAK